MADTAVGLFENAGVAEAVVDSLRAHGFSSSGIRIVSASAAVSSSSAAGDASFASKAAGELRSMGASEYESNAYVARLHRGNVLVYVTGTRQQADEAAGIMNEFSALELEEFATAGSKVSTLGASHADMGTINPEPLLPESQVTIGEHETTYTSHTSRAKTEGARIFTW
jgi:hypothetical protein